MNGENEAANAVEAKIQAYLDGALTDAEAQEVEALVEASSDAQRILERLEREASGLRALFDAEAEAMAAARPIALPAKDDAREASPRRVPWLNGRLAWAAPAGLAAAAGVALGLILADGPPPPGDAPGPPGWRLSAAVYQRLYTAETFASAPMTDAAIAGGLKTLGDRLGVDLSGLATPQGLSLERAQLLRFNGRALGQIAFLDAGGATLALCLMRRKEGADPVEDAPRFARSTLLDLNAVDWSDGRHDFLLLGAGSAESLEAYARAFARQLG